MNLNKFTKAELISKFKELKQNNSKTNPNSILIKFNSKIWKLLSIFKNIIAKLTLISFFIQIFRKYKIFRKLWLMLNTIVMSIFGISLLDNLGFEFLSNFFKEMKIITWNVVDYFSHTHFYNYLTELFSNKPSNETTNKNGSIISENKRETIGSEQSIDKSKTNSKISDWLKPEYNIKEINDDINNNSYKKYYIIAGVVIASSLIWIYQDEIYIGAISLYDWFNSFRSGPGNGGGGDTDNNTTPTSTNFQGQLNDQPSTSNIELIDKKGKAKVLTSPSLEDLNNKAKDSWSEGSTSPGSDSSSSSTDTIKPSDINNYFEVTAIESALFTRVKEEWKSLCPGSTQDKIKFIENNIDLINNFEIKKQIVKNLAEIEIDLLKYIEFLLSIEANLPENDILQSKLTIFMMNNWINEYNNRIFRKID